MLIMSFLERKILFGLILLIWFQPAFAEPEIRESYRYYEVYGDDPIAIRQSMNKQRKANVKGGYDAYVSWFLRWRFKYSDDLNGCYISNVSTQLKVRYTLPRLSNLAAKTKSTQARWRAYYDALLEHEHGHRDWGVNAARAIESKLKAMPYYRNCLDLRIDAQRKASHVLATYLRGEKNYDRITRHGATQGAIFP